MLPILLISTNKKDTQSFVKSLIKEYSISEFNTLQITPGTSTIGIDQIRDILSFVTTQTTQNRLILIDTFEYATVEAQNALLKLLEERNRMNLFVLISTSESSVLPTILSRVKVCYLSKTLKTIDEKRIQFFNKLVYIKNNITISRIFADPIIPKTKEDSISFIDDFVIYLHTHLLTSASQAPSFIKKALEIKNNILIANINYQFSLDYLLIFVYKRSTMKIP